MKFGMAIYVGLKLRICRDFPYESLKAVFASVLFSSSYYYLRTDKLYLYLSLRILMP
jgi:hypothetical protein